jgi:hypothetical protein
MNLWKYFKYIEIEVNGWEGMPIITLISMPEMTFNI